MSPAERVHGRRAEAAQATLFAALRDDSTHLAEETRAPLTRYLTSLGLTDTNRLVVGSGRVGTLQNAMGQFLDTKVGGIYLCVHDTPASRARPTMSGWVDSRCGGDEDSAMLNILYAQFSPSKCC